MIGRDEPGETQALTIRLFGGMSIQDQRGMDFLPRSRKTRAVVAALALNAPRPLLRMQLTALLWSQREKEQGRASLRQSVHELQQTLEPTWSTLLVAERHHLSLNLRGVTVDALAAAEPDAPRTQMLALFQQGFLEDLGGLDPSFDDWLLKQRRRLLVIARLAGETLLREDAPVDDRAEIARSLLRIDPAHDGAWRSLIQGRLDAGDRTGALFAGEQWREALGLRKDEAAPPDMAAFLDRLRWTSDRHTRRDFAMAGETEPSAAGGAEIWPDGDGNEGPSLDGQTIDFPEPGKDSGGASARRSGLRLGVREMRVIGHNVEEFLAAGLAEEITTSLARFRWISCVPASALAGYGIGQDSGNPRWSDRDPDLILDGTIQRSGDRLRITARLLDMRMGGEVIWAHRFDRTAADMWTLQEEVGAAIVARIDPLLLIREGERAAFHHSRGASPRDLVLQAVPAIYRLDRLSFHAAGELLEAALRIDPSWSEALAWFAYWHLFLVGQGWTGDADAATSRAASLADTAVAADPNDARALTLAGHVRGFLMKRPAEAIVLHDRAISLNPNLAIAWCFSGYALSYLGDHDTAIARIDQAIQLSPSDPHLFFFKAAATMPHNMNGRVEDAAALGLEAIELNPWFSTAFKGYLAALGLLGRSKDAADVRGRLLKLEPGFTVQDAIRRSPMTRPADIARYAEGLRQAGLQEE